MIKSKKAGIMESKLLQLILLAFFLIVIIALYIIFKDNIVENFKYIFRLF